MLRVRREQITPPLHIKTHLTIMQLVSVNLLLFHRNIKLDLYTFLHKMWSTELIFLLQLSSNVVPNLKHPCRIN